jgi:hypothetical protein
MSANLRTNVDMLNEDQDYNELLDMLKKEEGNKEE